MGLPRTRGWGCRSARSPWFTALTAGLRGGGEAWEAVAGGGGKWVTGQENALHKADLTRMALQRALLNSAFLCLTVNMCYFMKTKI